LTSAALDTAVHCTQNLAKRKRKNNRSRYPYVSKNVTWLYIGL